MVYSPQINVKESNDTILAYTEPLRAAGVGKCNTETFSSVTCTPAPFGPHSEGDFLKGVLPSYETDVPERGERCTVLTVSVENVGESALNDEVIIQRSDGEGFLMRSKTAVTMIAALQATRVAETYRSAVSDCGGDVEM